MLGCNKRGMSAFGLSDFGVPNETLFFFFFFNSLLVLKVYLFVLRQRQHKWGKGREREKETENPKLTVWSLLWGSNSGNPDIMT